LTDYLSVLSGGLRARERQSQIAEKKQRYLADVDPFVAYIHHFVEALELDAEQKNQQLRVIQIIREALSNVIRHAHASRAKVVLDCDAAGRVTILIQDNGTGLQKRTDMLQHYGLPIMQERAESLGGKLQVSEAQSGGTRIKLAFSLTPSDHSDTPQSVW
jgi:nitrate/nitrite-specific signal transduction histidine kinase